MAQRRRKQQNQVVVRAAAGQWQYMIATYPTRIRATELLPARPRRARNRRDRNQLSAPFATSFNRAQPNAPTHAKTTGGGAERTVSASASSVGKGENEMATPKEMETELAALRRQLKDEQELIEKNSAEWQTAVDVARDALAAFQKAALEREDALKAACPPAESPISMNWTMYDKRGAQVQITMRAGIDAEIVKRVFNARAEFVEQVLKGERGWTIQRTATPNAEAPTPPGQLAKAGN